jgi:hypothetical protein
MPISVWHSALSTGTIGLDGTKSIFSYSFFILSLIPAANVSSTASLAATLSSSAFLASSSAFNFSSSNFWASSASLLSSSYFDFNSSSYFLFSLASCLDFCIYSFSLSLPDSVFFSSAIVSSDSILNSSNSFYVDSNSFLMDAPSPCESFT